MIKQAIILAAGRGSRMLQLTDNVPKCLMHLGGKRLIDWQIKALHDAGIGRVFVVVGYLGDLLRREGFRCVSNPRWEQTNMVESLRCAHEILCQGDTIVVYGDGVYHPETLQALSAVQGEIAITYDLLWQELWESRFQNPLEDAETLRVHEGNILEIGHVPKTLEEIEGQFMGLVKCTPKGWSTIFQALNGNLRGAYQKMDITSLLQHMIEGGTPVQGIPIMGKWCEVDRSQDLVVYERKLQEGGWRHDWRH